VLSEDEYVRIDKKVSVTYITSGDVVEVLPIEE